MLSNDELEALTEVAALLKPLAVVTAEVCTKKSVSLSKIIPLTAYLKTVSILVSFFKMPQVSWQF